MNEATQHQNVRRAAATDGDSEQQGVRVAHPGQGLDNHADHRGGEHAREWCLVGAIRSAQHFRQQSGASQGVKLSAGHEHKPCTGQEAWCDREYRAEAPTYIEYVAEAWAQREYVQQAKKVFIEAGFLSRDAHLQPDAEHKHHSHDREHCFGDILCGLRVGCRLYYGIVEG